MQHEDIQRLRLAIGAFPTKPSDRGLVLQSDSIYRRMCGPAEPVYTGVMAGLMALMAHSPAMAWAVTDVIGRPQQLNEWKLLAWGVLYATFGGTHEVELVTERASRAHDKLRGVLDDGTAWVATDQKVIGQTYAALMWSILQAQEAMIGPLSRVQADEWCAQAAESVGASQQMKWRPTTHSELKAMYTELVSETRVQTCTSSTFVRMRGQRVNGVSMATLMDASSWMLPERTIEALGIERGPEPTQREFDQESEFNLMSLQQQT